MIASLPKIHPLAYIETERFDSALLVFLGKITDGYKE